MHRNENLATCSCLKVTGLISSRGSAAEPAALGARALPCLARPRLPRFLALTIPCTKTIRPQRLHIFEYSATGSICIEKTEKKYLSCNRKTLNSHPADHLERTFLCNITRFNFVGYVRTHCDDSFRLRRKNHSFHPNAQRIKSCTS